MEDRNEFSASATLDGIDGKALLLVPEIAGKSANAIELDSKIAKSYVGYCEIAYDLKHCLSFLFVLDENLDHIYSSEINQSLYQALIMLYAKCFRGAENRRRIKLDKKWLEGMQSELIGHHEYLISITNSHFAHAGDSNHVRY